MTQEEFYQECSRILGIEHHYHIPVARRTRWNNRILGNGRFPGFGLIHFFGPKVRIISKQGTLMLNGYTDALSYLEHYVQSQK